MNNTRAAKYKIGQVLRHRIFPFRGVVFDIDPVFNNTEEWYQSIPAEVRPHKDQPFYHLFAENSETEYIAYVSEQIFCLTRPANPCATRRCRKCLCATSRAAIARAITSCTEAPNERSAPPARFS